jgi:hypothetical protein
MPLKRRESMDINTQTQIEAAAFRQLLVHFQKHSDVQNIDLMILADFCRNCLAKWYLSAANEQGVSLSYEQAREAIYGMPYEQWKTSFQTDATEQQLAAYNQKQRAKNLTS